jgi:hypothetical protein
MLVINIFLEISGAQLLSGDVGLNCIYIDYILNGIDPGFIIILLCSVCWT